MSLSKETLMKLFGVEKKKSYQTNTGLLKSRVLNVAIKEINEFTELDVKYEEIKQGRSIVGFKVIWSTGKGIRKASEKQLDILRSIVDAVFADALMYAGINDKTNRERAMQIVRDFQHMKHYFLRPEVGLTADKASELARKASEDLDELNDLLEAEGIEQLEVKGAVPLFNWLGDL